jgi:phospholipid/cholesterol/gamma-HCH transport system substrate-binding protein
VPSQKQLQWSELRVGITVLVAAVTLGVLIFLMTGTTGLFTPKIKLKSYYDNAGGLRIGAPVRLAGVDIGNVIGVRIAPNHEGTPVEVTMKVSTKYSFNLRKDSVTSLATAGVLGEVYIDIDSSQAKGPEARDGDTLAIRDHPDIQDVVRASQGTLQNMDALLKRLDRIVAFVESGQGSIGKLIYDPMLYNRFAQTVTDFQGVVDEVRNGKGSIGKLIANDDAYNKLMGSIDKINAIVDDVQQGKGTAGKLLKDPALYNNANETVANVRKLTEDINAGRGSIGKLAKDEALAQKLDTTISKLAALTSDLEAGQGTAGKLFKDPSLYNNADQMLVETRQLVKSIRENPKMYLTFKVKVF